MAGMSSVAEDDHQGITDIRGEVVPGLELGVEGDVAAEDRGEGSFLLV